MFSHHRNHLHHPNQKHSRRILIAALLALAFAIWAGTAHGDETCNSPYTTQLITGQEDYVYVWTLGVAGLGDGSDKLVTVDVDPKSKRYGTVIHTVSVGGRGEAHHMGFTDDRRFLWAGGLADSKIHIFDIATDPAQPRRVNTITNLTEKTGYLGPHTFYALPGRMLVQALSNDKRKDGVTGMALYNNRGDFITFYAMPLDRGGDGYGYDLAVNPKKNVLLSSSFTGYANYMRPLGQLVNDPAAMQNFGNTMVLWDLKAMQPRKIFEVPGAPLEIRWSPAPDDNWAVTATALNSQLWLIRQDAAGEWQASAVADIGDPAQIPLPVDISIRHDGKGLWVNTFMDGKTRYFDLSNPAAPRQTYEKVTGKQVNMISQSWDGRRVYVTSSLLANWDKIGVSHEQFLRAFSWDGKELKATFEIDFTKAKLGRAHHMKLGARSLYSATPEPSAREKQALR